MPPMSSVSRLLPTRVRAGLVALTGGLFLAPAAAADLPKALDHVPVDSAIYVAVPSLSGALADVSGFVNAYKDIFPAEVQQQLQALAFAQLALSQPGVQGDGSAAIIVTPREGAESPEDADFLAILPISDFAAFAEGPLVAGLGPKIEADLMTLATPEGEVFLKDLGGFAAVGTDKALVRAHNAGKDLAAHATKLGRAGGDTAAVADAMVVANVAAIAPAINELGGLLAQQAQFAAAMAGDQAGQIQDGVELLQTVLQGFVRDGQVGVAALDIEPDGIAFELSANFKEGSEIAGFFSKGGDSGRYLGKLPRTDYLMAASFDTTPAGLTKIMDNVAAKLPKDAGGFDIASQITASRGGSMVLGASQALGGAGLFANQVQYYDMREGKGLGTLRTLVAELDGTAANGVKFSTTYEENAATIAGVKVDGYAISSTIDPAAGAAAGGMMVDPAMVQQMLFGFTGGPNGYIAEAGGGVYQTVSRNTPLLEKAIRAGRGEGESLADADLLKATAAKLMPGRVGEMYFSVDQVVNTFGPLAAMLGAMEAFEPAPALPPVGMGLATGEGGMNARVYVPGDVIKFVSTLIPENAGQMLQNMPQNPAGPRF